MAFRHASGPHAGKWEVVAKVVGGDGDTMKAWLIEFADGARAWVPKSCSKIEPLRDGQWAIYVPDWVAREKGWA